MPQSGRSAGLRPNSRLTANQPAPITTTVLAPNAISDVRAKLDNGIAENVMNKEAGIAR